ncbi:MFS transporter [Maricaulis maris]|uniref:MFS transporter n=1 Tax=Maricaulis maris TaxID=74318 RepID=UPI0026EF8595|nr:MFS transporter [Maricaulis maris]
MKTYLGYGTGDFGLNIYWNALSLILVFWYAEVVGLSPDAAGLIYFIGMAWDAVSDVVIANLTQRTRTRYGTYRPYLVIGGVILGAAFVLLFWVPPLEGWILMVALAMAHILFRLAYTIVAVPYSALASRLSFDSRERTVLSGTRMAFAFLGLLAVSGLWFPIVRFFGDGTDESPTGFLVAALLGGIIATIALQACFLFTRERTLETLHERPADLSFRGFWRAVRANRALQVLLLAIFLQSGAGASFLIPLAFYIEAHAADFARKEAVMTAYAVATLASIPVWTAVIRRFGKRLGWISTCWVVISAGLLLALLGPVLIGGLPLQILLYGVGFSGFGVLVWALVPDTVEFGQWKSGTRNEGAVFGSVLLSQKTAGGLAGLLVGTVLTAVGYDPDLARQSLETADRLELYMFAGPSILLFLSSLVILRLPLNRHIHAKIVEEIQSH